MAKVRSKVNVSITSVGGSSFQAIGNRINVSGPSRTSQEIDGTDMDSPSKEYFGDLQDGGELTVSGNFNTTDVGQSAVEAAVGNQRDVKVEYLNPADDSVLRTYDFTAAVLEWSTDASSGSMLTYECRFRISGAITRTDPV